MSYPRCVRCLTVSEQLEVLLLSTRRADSARGFLPAAAIADLAGTDTKVVFVARHQTTIGSPTLSRKTRNAVRVMQRRNTCASEDTAIPDFQHVAGDGSRSIERE